VAQRTANFRWAQALLRITLHAQQVVNKTVNYGFNFTVKRRKAIQKIGLGLSAGMALPWLSSCGKPDPEPEVQYGGTVAIIGAGAAGLYAADILSSKGVNVVILEAAKELGGRTKSLRNQPVEIRNLVIADFPVELGAEVIYGSDSIAGKIAANLNLPLLDIDAISKPMFALGTEVKAAADWAGDADFQAQKSFVEGVRNLTAPGQTLRQAAAAVPARAQALVNSQVANVFGSSSDRIGAQGIGESLRARTHNNKVTVLRGNPMQDMILSRFSAMATRVQTGKPVTAINYGTDTAVITTADGSTVEANKVVVTVPVSILKAGTIRFSPALPASKTTALSRISMDAAVRIVIEFKKNFWGEDTTFIWGGTSAIQIFNAGVGRSRFYQTTTITVYGPKAAELAALGNNMIPVLLAELDIYYNGQATQFVRRDLQSDQVIAVIQDWGKEEFIRGGISYLLPGGSMADRQTLSAPVGGRLFFAGEATDTTGDAGTVNGALASAERAAQQVIDAILAEA
jgi:monoamine oxidase